MRIGAIPVVALRAGRSYVAPNNNNSFARLRQYGIDPKCAQQSPLPGLTTLTAPTAPAAPHLVKP